MMMMMFIGTETLVIPFNLSKVERDLACRGQASTGVGMS